MNISFVFHLFLGLMLLLHTSCWVNRWECVKISGAPEDFDYLNCKDKKGRVRGWEFHFLNGYLESKVKYRKDVRHGWYINYYPNGNFREHGKYKHGKRHGSWSNFWSSGALGRISNYKNGTLNGYQYVYSLTGYVPPYPSYALAMKEHYKNGKKDGKSYMYDLEGNMTKVYIYSQDSLINSFLP